MKYSHASIQTEYLLSRFGKLCWANMPLWIAWTFLSSVRASSGMSTPSLKLELTAVINWQVAWQLKCQWLSLHSVFTYKLGDISRALQQTETHLDWFFLLFLFLTILDMVLSLVTPQKCLNPMKFPEVNEHFRRKCIINIFCLLRDSGRM